MKAISEQAHHIHDGHGEAPPTTEDANPKPCNNGESQIKSPKPLKFIIAGGKTGGHLFPAIAIAQALTRMSPESDILFVGSGEKFEVQTTARYGFQHRKIHSSGIKGKELWQTIKAAIQIPLSIVQAMGILCQFKPDMVIGVGGFASGPVLLAARLLGNIETAIQEQNSMAGITNRILSRFVHVVFTSYKETKGLEKARETVLTGNPIRKETLKGLQDVSHGNGEPPTRSRPVKRAFTILVTGGSQGARSINSAVVNAMEQFAARLPISKDDISIRSWPDAKPATPEHENGIHFHGKEEDTKKEDNVSTAISDKSKDNNVEVSSETNHATPGRTQNRDIKTDEKKTIPSKEHPVRVIHQTGYLDEERILNLYHLLEEKALHEGKAFSKAMQVTARAFFNDMPRQMQKADLIICRAGAGTLSEVTAIGRPALLVPYPFAADDHQTFNAKTLVNQGAACMIADSELTGETIMEKISYAVTHPDEMKQMANASKALGMPHADDTIARLCIERVKGK